MKCPYCQSDVLDGAVVCTHCNRDFAVMAHVLRGVEQSRDATELEIAQLKAEVESITQRVVEAEAQLPKAAIPFAARRPLTVLGLTGAAVAATSAASWQIEDTAISEPLLLLSFALAPVVAGLAGALRGLGTPKESTLLGAGAALAILVVQWIYSGFDLSSSWPAVAVLVATPAANMTGQIVKEMTDESEPTTKAALGAAEQVAGIWPTLKPLTTAAVALVPVLAGFIAEDNTQEVQAEEVQLEENVEEKEERAQVFLPPSTQPTTTTTTAPATSSTSTEAPRPGTTAPPGTSEPGPEVEPEQAVLTLDEVVGRRLLEDGLLSPLQLSADSASEASGAGETFLTLAESAEFQQKLRTLQAMDLITFIDDDYSTVEVTSWGLQALAAVSGEQTATDLDLLATDATLSVGDSTTVVESARFPVYLELDVDGGDGGRPISVVIGTALTTDEGDAVLSLYTFEERVFIGRDDDGGSDFNARLVACDLAPGRYLIEVDRFGDVGGFTVAVTAARDEAACTAG